jgi:hypothetical protein
MSPSRSALIPREHLPRSCAVTRFPAIQLRFLALFVPALVMPQPSVADAIDDVHALMAPCKSVLHSPGFSLFVPMGKDRKRVPGHCETKKVVTSPGKRPHTRIEIQYVCHAVSPATEAESVEFYARRTIFFTASGTDWRAESAVLELTGIPPTTSEIRTKSIPTASLGSLLPLATKCVGSL